MPQFEESIYSNTAFAHSMTFRGLNAYQVDKLCDIMFCEFERMVFDMPTNARMSSLKSCEFKQVFISGMRKFHKETYDGICKEQTISEGMNNINKVYK